MKMVQPSMYNDSRDIPKDLDLFRNYHAYRRTIKLAFAKNGLLRPLYDWICGQFLLNSC